MRAANLINAQLADAWFHEPVKRAFVFIGAAQWLALVADMSSHEIIKNGGDVSCGRRGRTILKRVLPAVNALAQIARLAYGFERRPIWPSTDGEAMFATAQAVVEHKGTSAGGGDADTEAARCLGALDHGARKIGDAVPLRRDWQPLDRLFAQVSACHALVSALCPHNQFT